MVEKGLALHPLPEKAGLVRLMTMIDALSFLIPLPDSRCEDCSRLYAPDHAADPCPLGSLIRRSVVQPMAMDALVIVER
jgi:hypothetical protein